MVRLRRCHVIFILIELLIEYIHAENIKASKSAENG
jgi:hypothetical protein